MENKKVALLGFDFKMKLLFGPLIREMFAISDYECIASVNDLEKRNCHDQMDMLVINSFYIGFEVERKMKRITRCCPETRLVCFSPNKMIVSMCLRYIRSGIDILLSNFPTVDEYQKAMSALSNGRRYFPSEARETLERGDSCEPMKVIRFSPKEMEVIDLTMCGYCVKQIASRMCIKVGTVGSIRKRAMRKMGVHNLAQLIHVAIKLNIVKREEDIVI